MTSNSNHFRKPAEASTYAPLHASTAPRHHLAPSADNEILSEGERLRALREALWSAFEAGPAAGLPNVLIDLTMAYTSSLRLQLNLKALSTRSTLPRAKVTPGMRSNPPDKA